MNSLEQSAIDITRRHFLGQTGTGLGAPRQLAALGEVGLEGAEEVRRDARHHAELEASVAQLIEQRHLFPNDARLFQLLNPPPTRCCREMHPPGDLRFRHGRVFLKTIQYRAIDIVHTIS